ncbi:MAG: family 10 glycosylhydrolase [Bacteroidales bacterium]|nr:family 10 glycosylhydrolase [Bacteroidales bacterium]
MRYTLLILFLLSSYFVSKAQVSDKPEMRAVWIATVKNIDFPSYAKLTVDEQKKEFTDMLDKFSDVGINAIMFQVRPAADAFFPSEFEPWSEWLTGKQGKAPEPYYDPLEFMIEECHKRNIEFHAWINPFRAVATIEFADIAENHITKTKPEWFFTYDINKYFDPGIPEVRNYVRDIIVDIVKRYDIDGVHFDDYFYPYPKRDSYNRIMKIPDNKTFQKYKGEFEDIADWRRNNMDLFIEEVNKGIKKADPNMVFGVAPSGVWRNKSQDPDGSNTRALAHYDYLYSDVIAWLRNGWIDYVAPQLYWPIGHKYADYKTLVDWWSKHTYGKHLYIGHAVYRTGKDASSATWRNPNEIPNQIRIIRENPNVNGSIFYKAKSLTENRLGLLDSLKNNFYAIHVQTPEMPWLKQIDTTIIANNTDNNSQQDTSDNLEMIPVEILTQKLGNKIVLSWKTDIDTSQKKEHIYNVYKFRKYDFKYADENDIFKTTKQDFIVIKRKRFKIFRKEYKFVVTFVDKSGNESSGSNEISIKL